MRTERNSLELTGGPNGVGRLPFSSMMFEGPWPFSASDCAELDARLNELEPHTIVEFGSGASTVILSRYAYAHGAHVYSYESDEKYYERTMDLLSKWGEPDAVSLMHRPLAETPLGPIYVDWNDGEYSSRLYPDFIDFVLIDAPTQRQGGRGATLPAIADKMNRGCEIWLDDALRPEESAIRSRWVREFGLDHRLLISGKGVGISARFGGRESIGITRREQDASDVFISVLGGGRPRHLEETLNTLTYSNPGLFNTAKVAFLISGGDAESENEVRETACNMPDAEWLAYDSQLSIGEAMSELAGMAKASGKKYWLHIEDDWRFETANVNWLDEARLELSKNELTKQVRLRHISEPVRSHNLATGYEINWNPRGAGFDGIAHFTFNPFIMRIEDIGSIFPCTGEMDAMKKFDRMHDWYVHQQSPGCFLHTGDGASVRVITRCEP